MEVTASLSGVQDVVMVGSDGTLAADVEILIRCNVSVIAERNGRRDVAVPVGVAGSATTGCCRKTVLKSGPGKRSVEPC